MKPIRDTDRPEEQDNLLSVFEIMWPAMRSFCVDFCLAMLRAGFSFAAKVGRHFFQVRYRFRDRDPFGHQITMSDPESEEYDDFYPPWGY